MIEAERSIIKKYRQEIWSRFIKAVQEYELVKEGDKIAVCISGGKDSFLLAKCMQELKIHGKFNFDLIFIVMNPGYNEKNRLLIEENAKKLNIPIQMFDYNIFDYVTRLDKGSPCYICARMRRGALYNKAKELGCNKIALGHHFNDVIETTLLGILYSGDFKTMMPKLHSDNYEGMELIRPLYYVRERDIISWKEYNNLVFINCACKFTEESNIDESKSKRKEIKKLIEELMKTNEYTEINIFKSLYNVNLDGVIEYQKNKERHNFLDDYDTKK